MILSEVKNSLARIDELKFMLPSGAIVPTHFHVTEVGLVNKKFIDCGGTIRNEEVVNFQLWEGEDTDHRLAASKLKDIIELSEKLLALPDAEVEVEYQGETIGKFDLAFENKMFHLQPKKTNCLAKDKCIVPKPRLKFAELGKSTENACTPGGGCC